MKNYVKKHKGHDVPIGATRYNDSFKCMMFYKWHDGSPFAMSSRKDSKWSKQVIHAQWNESTELPEQEQDLPNWDEWEGWDKQDELDAAWLTDSDCVGLGWFKLNESSMTYEELYQPIGRIKHRYTVTEEVSGRIIVHKRPIAIEDKEWLPVVGEECLGNLVDDAHNYAYIKIKPLYNFGGEWAVQKVDAGTLAYCDQFRPLKTAEEVMREMFILDCFNATPLGKTDSYTEMFGSMFDLGFTAPKGEG